MSGRAALRYAKATLSFAVDKKLENKVNDDMVLVHSTLKENKDLQEFLKNPITRLQIKEKTLTKIFSSKVSDLTLKLFQLLIVNNRLDILNEVAQKYIQIFDEYTGKEVAKITTAFPLTDTLENKVLNKVKELTGKTASLENHINPDIIGGFVLRIGDMQYDASIANKLQTLKRQFEN
ncbi:MAG: ATP synthase F1 subunit delta [Lutibacter sp.]